MNKAEPNIFSTTNIFVTYGSLSEWRIVLHVKCLNNINTNENLHYECRLVYKGSNKIKLSTNRNLFSLWTDSIRSPESTSFINFLKNFLCSSNKYYSYSFLFGVLMNILCVLAKVVTESIHSPLCVNNHSPLWYLINSSSMLIRPFLNVIFSRWIVIEKTLLWGLAVVLQNITVFPCNEMNQRFNKIASKIFWQKMTLSQFRQNSYAFHSNFISFNECSWG